MDDDPKIVKLDRYKTEQEKFWAGKFGSDYIKRNPDNYELGSRLSLLAKVLSRTEKVDSIIEFGANIGNNLKALALLLPDAELSAIEINGEAVKVLEKWGRAKVYHNSIFDFQPDYQRDLAFVSGVLIHINPDMLPLVYDLLHLTSKKYILLVEYYNPTPVEIPYRGHSKKLFKRDFAGEILERFPKDLSLIDYGFVYRRDPNFPLDDLTWFLMEKNDSALSVKSDVEV